MTGQASSTCSMLGAQANFLRITCNVSLHTSFERTITQSPAGVARRRKPSHSAMSRPQDQDRNQEATVYLGNLDERCTDALLRSVPLLTVKQVLLASYDKKQLDVGANLFIGNLDPLVDETMLYNTFSTFGPIATTAKVARDPQTGESKGYGFVSYNDFDHSDAAVEAMNGQYLMNKPITVQYAFKKDGKGERHGTEAERLLANQAKYAYSSQIAHEI
ncbi:hypothetical protein QFC19_007655 [Naganishia cerealis]|uniref:Uncharacterized protein n=1 Tax=Naganishia cerealis TaxID=610337 RepID=A0ACC2V766_9TREE|nr:hypothetical protein QFC19_007655 [Naganishia cerealis]